VSKLQKIEFSLKLFLQRKTSSGFRASSFSKCRRSKCIKVLIVCFLSSRSYTLSFAGYGTPVDTLRKPMRSVVPLGEVTTDLEVPVKFDRTVSPRPKRASKRGMRSKGTPEGRPLVKVVFAEPPTKGRRPLRPVMEEEERSPVPVRDPLEGVEWTSAEQFFEMPDEEVQQSCDPPLLRPPDPIHFPFQDSALNSSSPGNPRATSCPWGRSPST
jgi:hypothetical protein